MMIRPLGHDIHGNDVQTVLVAEADAGAARGLRPVLFSFPFFLHFQKLHLPPLSK